MFRLPVGIDIKIIDIFIAKWTKRSVNLHRSMISCQEFLYKNEIKKPQ